MSSSRGVNVSGERLLPAYATDKSSRARQCDFPKQPNPEQDRDFDHYNFMLNVGPGEYRPEIGNDQKIPNHRCSHAKSLHDFRLWPLG
jgi:hypothetical protein